MQGTDCADASLQVPAVRRDGSEPQIRRDTAMNLEEIGIKVLAILCTIWALPTYGLYRLLIKLAFFEKWLFKTVFQLDEDDWKDFELSVFGYEAKRTV